MNQSSSFTESCGVGGVKSHGRSTVFPGAAQTRRAGTANKKEKKVDFFISKQKEERREGARGRGTTTN